MANNSIKQQQQAAKEFPMSNFVKVEIRLQFEDTYDKLVAINYLEKNGYTVTSMVSGIIVEMASDEDTLDTLSTMLGMFIGTESASQEFCNVYRTTLQREMLFCSPAIMADLKQRMAYLPF